MSPPPSPAPPGLSRRAFLAASAAGLTVVVAGCTADPVDPRQQVTSRQADELATQVAVQASLVAAFAAAAEADPPLGAAVAEQAEQAARQLGQLQDAATGAAASGSSAPDPGAPVGPEARAWLRAQVAEAAASHAAASLDQSGARAALLGSIAAGLRGHEAVLA